MDNQQQSADVVRRNGRQYQVLRYGEKDLSSAGSKTLACSEAPCTGTGRARVCLSGRWNGKLHWEV